jgi:hypothetical protein
MRSLGRYLQTFGGAVALATFCCLSYAAADSDNDGVPDEWKKNGFVDITLPSGQRQRLNLKQDGPLTAGRKDVFVWVAWMQDSKHSHKPDAKAMSIVREAFARAPVANADGSEGIRLHVFYSPVPLLEQAILGGATPTGEYDWTEFDKIKSNVFPKELEKVFRFCIFAHDIDPDHHSGMSKGIGSYDFIVSLGAFEEDGKPAGAFSQAGTFMHELGHNLGLHHGGADDVNYKPNYISVMNYLFQLNGIFVDQRAAFDYSRFEMVADENKLDRSTGLTKIADLKNYGTQYYCDKYGDATQSADSIAGPIDWDCSGQTSGLISQDVNRDGSRGKLVGFDDWKHLVLKPAPSAGVTPLRARLKLRDELTLGKANLIAIRSVSRVVAAQKEGGVVIQWQPVPNTRVLAYEINRVSATGEQVTLGAADAKATTFRDEKAPKGRQSYRVRAVYKPFGNPAAVKASQVLVSHPVILTEKQFLELGRVSPNFKAEAMEMINASAKMEVPKGTSAGGAALPPKPPLLLKTSFSNPATLEVR